MLYAVLMNEDENLFHEDVIGEDDYGEIFGDREHAEDLLFVTIDYDENVGSYFIRPDSANSYIEIRNKEVRVTHFAIFSGDAPNAPPLLKFPLPEPIYVRKGERILFKKAYFNLGFMQPLDIQPPQ